MVVVWVEENASTGATALDQKRPFVADESELGLEDQQERCRARDGPGEAEEHWGWQTAAVRLGVAALGITRGIERRGFTH